MKNLIVISLVCTVLGISCQNKPKGEEEIGVVEEVVVENDTMDEMNPNPSDISFMNALQEYEDGNYEQAADYVEDGVIHLREEEKDTENVNGRLLDQSIEKLRNLEEKLRNNQVKDIDLLTQAMVNAEMLVAHDYIIYTMHSLTESPTKTTYYFDKAMESLDRVIPKLTGKTKEEAVDIRNESIKIADKLGQKNKHVMTDLQRQTNKIQEFLAKHANEMM